MHDLYHFLNDFFKDPRRNAGAMTLILAIAIGVNWIESLGTPSSSVNTYVGYGATTIALTLASAYLLLGKDHRQH